MADKPDKLSKKVDAAIKAVQGPFKSFTKDFNAVALRRDELAPKFMRALTLWQGETGGTFVDFVRVLDPSVGKTREEYRAHRSYQAADYLRRLSALGRAGATQRMQNGGDQPVTPTRAIARILAVVFPLLSSESVGILWSGIQNQLHWSDRQIAQMKNMVRDAVPVVNIKAPKTIQGSLKVSTSEAA